MRDPDAFGLKRNLLSLKMYVIYWCEKRLDKDSMKIKYTCDVQS